MWAATWGFARSGANRQSLERVERLRLRVSENHAHGNKSALLQNRRRSVARQSDGHGIRYFLRRNAETRCLFRVDVKSQSRAADDHAFVGVNYAGNFLN